MMEASQGMLKVNSQGEEPGGINAVIKRHLELEIKTLQNAPRDPDKLERLLQIRLRQKEEEAMHIEDTERLVIEEIEMLKVVLYWCAVKIESEREGRGKEEEEETTNP
jgi:hypothetical protein